MQLQNMHIIVDVAIVAIIFNQESHAQVVYYPQEKLLMLAANSDKNFQDIHKTHPRFLKVKNLQGDRAIAIHDILIDNDLDKLDRVLKNEVNEITKIIHIFL